jgi:hypothetical protein
VGFLGSVELERVLLSKEKKKRLRNGMFIR